MNVELLPGSPVALPVIAKSRSPFSTAAFEDSGHALELVERRHGISELELASLILTHAVQYLSMEQRARRCTSVRSNRQAITILCECAEMLMELERREPAREAMESWLAGARSS